MSGTHGRLAVLGLSGVGQLVYVILCVVQVQGQLGGPQRLSSYQGGQGGGASP